MNVNEVIKTAPHYITHIGRSKNGEYWYVWKNSMGEWYSMRPRDTNHAKRGISLIGDLRNIGDVKRITELLDENEKMVKTASELEKEILYWKAKANGEPELPAISTSIAVSYDNISQWRY